MSRLKFNMGLLMIILILCQNFMPSFNCQYNNSSTSNIRDEILSKIFRDYKKYERPNSLNVTHVDVNMKVLAIFSIDVRTMDYFVDIYLRQNWTDPRLAWEKSERLSSYESIASPKIRDNLWLPDLFFRNGKEGFLHMMTLPNYLIRVYKNGSILYSQKITMRFSCQMHLQTFPMDTQTCEMNIGSYAYTAQELKFSWKKGMAIEIEKNLQISEFNTPKMFETIDCSSTYATSTGQFSCLIARFKLKRQLGSYLATTYIPNILIIIASWLSFWVNVEAAPARVPLGLLSLLGILTQATGVTTNLPRVSYIKAIDIWTIFNIMFIIGVLVEYAIALTLLRKTRKISWKVDMNEIVRKELIRWCAACHENHREKMANTKDFPLNMKSLEAMIVDSVLEDKTRRINEQSLKPPTSPVSPVDMYSRYIFPSCYILYNTFYWVYYLVLVEYFK